MENSDLDSVCRELLNDPATPEVLRIFARGTRDMVAQVPVVGVVGRVNTGKSTLVNALLGRLVAPTDSRDSTRHVTVYRFGTPEAAWAVFPGGQRAPVALDLSEVGSDPDISHLDVRLQTDALRHLTLIDTPGVQGLDVEAGPAVRRALAQADLIVHLFRGELRYDDAALAAEFAGSTDAAGFTRSRVLGVLAHADSYGPGGSSDPIELARADCAELSVRHRRHFSEVIPLSALLAETTATGQLTEADTRVLQGLGDADPDRARAVLGKVGHYGLVHGAPHASSSTALIDFLAERSGLARLRAVLGGTMFGLARARRAVEAVRRLENVLQQIQVPPRTAALLNYALRGATGHLALELAAYEALVSGYPRSRLIPDLERLLGALTREERLAALARRLGSVPGPQQLAEESRRYQGEATMSSRGVETQAARVLSMSLHYLAQGG